jgi:hypothetical protein
MERAVFDRMAEIDSRALVVRRPARDHRQSDRAAGQASAGRPASWRSAAAPAPILELLMRYGRSTRSSRRPARALARQRSGIAVKGGLLPDGVELEDGAYDLIVLLDVLEHIPTTRHAGRAPGKLAPGGRCWSPCRPRPGCGARTTPPTTIIAATRPER